jgi:hypothetical protein
MAEVGCLRDGNFQNLQVEENINTGGVSSKYLDFVSASCSNLTGTPRVMTDAHVDAAAAGTISAAEHLLVQITPNALSTCAFTADAAGEVYLPPAIANTHCALKILGDMDAANALTFVATETVAPTGGVATTGKFAGAQIIGPNYPGTATNPQSVITVGTNVAGTSVNLIYTPAAAATNFLSLNSIIHFYCKDEGFWMVKVENIAEGTGATGAFTVS